MAFPLELTERILCHVGDGAPEPREKVRVMQEMRGDPRVSEELDYRVVKIVEQHLRALAEARGAIGELESLLRELTAAPWHQAVFVGTLPTDDGERAVVAYQSHRRTVTLSEDVDLEELRLGDQVYLGPQLNCILARSADGPLPFGQTAVFDRALPDGRAMITLRDETQIVEFAGEIASADLERGDTVRYDPVNHLVYEVIEREDGQQYLLTETPNVGKDRIGGQDRAREELLSGLTAALVYPDRARAYGLDARRCILMYGPPGNGKTTLARIAATELQRITGKTCQFAVVKPGEWEDPYVGVTQQNIRRFFQVIRSIADQNGLAVVFFDEVDSIARQRGSAVGHHRDSFLAAFLAEVEGFAQRGNIAIVSATNRPDLLDSAARQRLGQIEIQVGAPNASGARQVFEIHLSPGYPYSPNGAAASDTRAAMTETAVAMLYAAGSEGELSRLRFRDGKERVVSARELVSGRIIEQICLDARQRAFRREETTGPDGLRVEDMLGACSDAMDKLSGLLTPRNAREYLADLPDDNDVVSTESLRINQRVKQPRRYTILAHEPGEH